MCRICTRAIARLLAPTYIGVPFALDEKGIDGGLFHQDQSYFPSDRVPFRERPVIVDFLAGHREALNRRHCGADSATDAFTETARRLNFLSPGCDNGRNRKRPAGRVPVPEVPTLPSHGRNKKLGIPGRTTLQKSWINGVRVPPPG